MPISPLSDIVNKLERPNRSFVSYTMTARSLLLYAPFIMPPFADNTDMAPPLHLQYGHGLICEMEHCATFLDLG